MLHKPKDHSKQRTESFTPFKVCVLVAPASIAVELQTSEGVEGDWESLEAPVGGEVLFQNTAQDGEWLLRARILTTWPSNHRVLSIDQQLFADIL